MKLSVPQQHIADDLSRFKVVVAGRRFGKSYLSMREICYRARIPNQEIFYLTTSYRAAKMILWKPLKRRLLDLRWANKINETEMSIQLKNGSTISLKGAEDPDRLRGVSLSYCVIDEAADCKLETLWGEVVRPALADQQGGAMFIGTPKGRSNPFFDLYNYAKDAGHKDWAAWQYTTLEGGFVTETEINAARQDMSEKQFKQEFEASFETDESRVAWAFERDTHVIEPTLDIDTREIFVGMDFNVNPMSVAVASRTGDTLTVFDELAVYSSNTDEIADEILNRYPSSKVYCFPDPAGAARKTSANSMTDHKILENRGFIVKAPRKHDAVKDRINATNARFRNAKGDCNLYITKNCKHTIESLEKHSFKQGTMIPDKDSGYDHQFDALSYMVAFLYPIRKQVALPTQPQRWGHAIR
jgi:phage terminase large subunit